jgi:hypothetical protein
MKRADLVGAQNTMSRIWLMIEIHMSVGRTLSGE